MSIIIHTQTKMALPWFIRAIVASASIFREFFLMRTVLEKWIVSFMHGVVGSGSLRLWFIRFMYGIFGSFAHWRKEKMVV